FSEDGRLVIGLGSDGVVRVWEISTGREIGRVFGNGVAFAQRSNVLMTVAESDPRRVVFSQIGASTLIEEICRRSVRNLTESEWRDYIPSEPTRATCPNLHDP